MERLRMKYDGLRYDGGIWEELRAKINATTERQKEALRDSLRESANELLFYSQLEVPEDTGYLQMTAYVDDLGDSFNVVYSAKAGDRASYAEDDDFSGDPDYNYAWIQHEATWFKHKKGKAKYLTDPYNAHKDEWIRNAANAVRNASSSTRGRAKAKASKVRRKGKR